MIACSCTLASMGEKNENNNNNNHHQSSIINHHELSIICNESKHDKKQLIFHFPLCPPPCKSTILDDYVLLLHIYHVSISTHAKMCDNKQEIKPEISTYHQ